MCHDALRIAAFFLIILPRATLLLVVLLAFCVCSCWCVLEGGDVEPES